MKKLLALSAFVIALSFPADPAATKHGYFDELAQKIQVSGGRLPEPEINPRDGSSYGWKELKTLALLLEFSDIKSTLKADRIIDTFTNPDNPKSLASYYNAASNGGFGIDFGSGIKPWIKLGNPWIKYRKPKGDYSFLPELLSDGLDAAKRAGVSTEEYDRDKNGYPDNVVFVWSGNSWSAGGDVPGGFVLIDANWSVMCLGEDPKPMFDWIEPFYPMTLWHETAHFLHLRDLYDHTYITYSPVGAWDLMGDGNWSGYGGLNAFNRWKCGWLDLREIKEEGTYTVSDLNGTDGDRGLIIEIPGGANEWIIVENRQYSGVDQLYGGIPASGLVFYHYDAGRPYDGRFNDSSDRFKFPGLAVISRKPAKHHLEGCFSADSGRTSLNKANAPGIISYYNPGHKSTLEFSNISKSGPTMTFDLRFKAEKIIEVSAPSFIDFGRIRKGTASTKSVKFTFNGDSKPLVRLKADVPWIEFDISSFVGVEDEIAITVNTERMFAGRQRGAVIYSSDSNTGKIGVAVDVRPMIGDCNGDDRVNLEDWDLFTDRLGSASGDLGYDADLDFDGDGAIDVSDAFLLSRRFGR